MKILLSGASGFLGGHVQKELLTAGHSVTAVSRSPVAGGESVDWSRGALAAAVAEADAVCHLAGEPVLGRWTKKRRENIIKSRVETTTLLAELLAEKGSGALVQASAVGFYGDRGADEVDEETGTGSDFLAGVCRAWEEAAEPARAAGIRVAAVRIGVILGANGGALKHMLLPFKLGLGGRLGSGRQFFPWVHVGDLARLFRFLLESKDASGVFNGTAPEPVSNRDFTRELGHALGRPTILPVPALAMRLLLGEVSSMFLTGQRAYPKRALEAGFRFNHPELGDALGDLLGGGSRKSGNGR
ncbi:MAG: hypothetical protein ACI8QS_001550 [Planctomycetota bacterium]|jgi:uncharacterized protein (TIGR01777 family)